MPMDFVIHVAPQRRSPLILLLCGGVFGILFTWTVLRSQEGHFLRPAIETPSSTQSVSARRVFRNGEQVFSHPFGPVALDDNSRRPDFMDAFENFTYRRHSNCDISSLSLHTPFSPLCESRAAFLDAYTGGGRIGFDAPFMPRGCDMRWFATDEICEIFSRYEKVIMVGDSMIRHVAGALNVLLREDLGYGAVTGWNFNEDEMRKCFCTHQMDVKACSVQGVYRTADVLKNDPDSFACPKRSVKSKDNTITVESDVHLIIEMMLKFPLDPTEIERFQQLLSPTKTNKPYAFILGHGLWNDLDLQATINWLDGVIARIEERAPYLKREHNLLNTKDGLPWANILFMTPNAAGVRKPDEWVVSQGDKALQIFEKSAREVVAERYGGRVEHIGTWNMSVQMDKWDGVHLDLTGNLVKAMGVVNWLSLLDVQAW